MERNNRRGRKRHNWNDSKNQNNKNRNANQKADLSLRPPVSKFRYIAHENIELQQQKEKAIKEFHAREVMCPVCGERIVDVASALTDKTTGKPVHFDCVMKHLSETETLGQNEKLAYIGQGRFAILYYENIRDQRHFQIKKIIEVEDRAERAPWRDEVSGLFSQVE